MQGYRLSFSDIVLVLSFVAGLSFTKVGEILGNVDNDIHVRFKHKQPSSPISGFFRGMPPLSLFNVHEK